MLNSRSLQKQKDVGISLKATHSPKVLWSDMTSHAIETGFMRNVPSGLCMV